MLDVPLLLFLRWYKLICNEAGTRAEVLPVLGVMAEELIEMMNVGIACVLTACLHSI